VRLVRTQAGFVLSAVPSEVLDRQQREARSAAVKEYIAGVALDNDSARATTMIGLMQERLAQSPDDIARAIATHRQAIRVEPNVTGPRGNLASLLQRLAAQEPDPAKAQQMHLDVREVRREESRLLGRHAELLPDRPDVQQRYGYSLHLIGEHDAAAAAFRRAAELAPTSAEFVWQLGLIYEEQKKLGEATAAVARAQQLAPHSVEILFKLAQLQAQQQQWQDAADSLKKLIVLDPGDPTWPQLLQRVEAAAQGQ
jgi:tetratricopeptide (TPR) repeat protein